MNRLKIALYTQSFPPKGGGVSTTHFNMFKLLNDTYNVKVFAFNENENFTSETLVKRKTIRWFTNLLFQIIKFKYKSNSKFSKLTNVKSIVNSFVPVIRLNSELKKFNPDIIIIPDYNIPNYVIHKPRNSKLVLIAHHNYLRFQNNLMIESNDWLDLSIASSMEKKAMNKVDAIISPSQFMISKYKDSLYKNKPIFCIHNFIEQRNFIKLKTNLKTQKHFPKDKQIVYIPSAGSVIKGKRYVFEIVRRLLSYDKNIFFYLTGEIPDDLNFELSKFKDNIYAPGHINWEANLANVMMCHIGITPNLEENFSNAILEAQIAGLPFVAFDTGGNKEIIINDYTGFIVPFLDVESLILKSCYLLNDYKKREVFQNNAVNSYTERFADNLILSNYDTVLTEINNL